MSVPPYVQRQMERAVLRVICRGIGVFPPTECCWTFRGIMEETGLPRDYVRAACRSLTDQGLAHYKAGLFNEDGETAGAGYGATQAGVDLIAKEEWDESKLR